jgi:ribosome-associated toxin RatA of RatAB toxin-antitoxin module
MAVIERKAHVSYSAEQMLALVNDIHAYPEFLHWCHGARIESSKENTVEAALEIGIAGIYKTFRTRNTTSGSPGDSRIDIEMIQGPLKKLHGSWYFTDDVEGCDIRLTLEYEVQFSPFGAMLKTLFDEIANSQLNAFIRRAGTVYGKRSS